MLSRSRGQQQTLQWPNQASDWATCLLDHLGRRHLLSFREGVRIPLPPTSSGFKGQIQSYK